MSKIRTPIHPDDKVGSYDGPLVVAEGLKDPEYVYRWVNDSGYNIPKKRQQGYDFTPVSNLENLKESLDSQALRDQMSTDGTYICRIVDTGGQKAYLMRISRDLYEARKREREEADVKARENMGLIPNQAANLKSELNIQQKEE